MITAFAYVPDACRHSWAAGISAQVAASRRLHMTAADWLEAGGHIPILPHGVGEDILLPGQQGVIEGPEADRALEEAAAGFSCVGMPLIPTEDGSTLVTVLELIDAPSATFRGVSRGVSVKCVGRALAPGGCRPSGGSSHLVPFTDSTLELVRRSLPAILRGLSLALPRLPQTHPRLRRSTRLWLARTTTPSASRCTLRAAGCRQSCCSIGSKPWAAVAASV